MDLQIEDIDSPLIKRIQRQTSRQYSAGMVKITPSDCVLPRRYRDWAQRMKDFEVREDDVWIVTYPKCGTTWTQEMVWLIMHDLDFEGAKESLFTRSPFVEFWACVVPEEERDFGTEDTIKLTEESKSPRCIKSHLPKDLLPDQLWTKKPKIVYVTRSAKDVVVSFFHHHKLMNGYTGTLEEFLEYFMNENVLAWDPFWNHILQFWKIKDESHILINSYEEMKKDLQSVIRRTAKFLGKSFTDQQIAQLSEHLQFKNMRENKSVNYEEVTKMFEEKFNVSGQFMRHGEIGSSLRELNKEQLSRFDAWSREKVAGTDYPFIG